MEAAGLPEGSELAFLQALGDVVPQEIYTAEPWHPHVSDADRLTSIFSKMIETNGVEFPVDKLPELAPLLQERITSLNDLWSDGNFLFSSPDSYDEKVVKKKWNRQLVEVISTFGKRVSDKELISSTEAKSLLEEILLEKGMGLGQIMQGLRVAITGKGGGPDLMEIIKILGGPEVNLRIERAIELLPIKEENNA